MHKNHVQCEGNMKEKIKIKRDAVYIYILDFIEKVFSFLTLSENNVTIAHHAET